MTFVAGTSRGTGDRDDFHAPYGIRTHATSEPDFDPYGYHTGAIWPHDNWFFYKGLRAQGRDSDARRIRDALLRTWEELGKMPNTIVVEGHTDSNPMGESVAYTNWELSADRANSARRVMQEKGLDLSGSTPKVLSAANG